MPSSPPGWSASRGIAASVPPASTQSTPTTRFSPPPSSAASPLSPATRGGMIRAKMDCCLTSTSRWARRRRTSQDEFGVRSQNLAEKAIANQIFNAEIAPVTLPDGTVVSTDDGPRPGTTIEAVSALKPAFRPDGTVTAGNCCPLNDGAAAVVIMSDRRAAELGLTPLARIVATGVSALSPEIMGLGPVEASHRALASAQMTIQDMDLVEINEAFAVQVIASARDLGLDMERLNVHGGAIALGHPFGCTGARIMTTLLNAMRVRDVQFGLETMCVGGGQGMAIVLERLL